MIKKVYADYHGLRYSREIDGDPGQWKLSGTARKSSVPDRYVNWNADVIDINGRHQTSAQAYPVVGMQSQNDPDYIEYQILLAKAAGIDGFMVEWGFPGHQSDRELQLLLEVAKKHSFEIGITWCDAWHFYDWIEQFYPDIRNREDKVEQFKRSLQYLLDTVYASEAGAVYNGHPIIFLFGGGPTAEEFAEIIAADYRLAPGLKKPLFFGRAPIIGRLEAGTSTEGMSLENDRPGIHTMLRHDGLYETVMYAFDENEWFRERPAVEGGDLLDGCFGWIPTRVRPGHGSDYPHWDRYATKEDAIAYLEKLNEANDERKHRFKLKISSVNPEMDNRGCASWDKHDLSHVPREQGAVYEAMWQYNCAHRDEIDIVFVVTWNDFTEMTQIEPTIEDGAREIVTTAQYASLFKEIPIDPSGIDLPLELFQLRKMLAFCQSVSRKREMVEVREVLDTATSFMGEMRYKEAAAELKRARQLLQKVKSKIACKKLSLNLGSKDLHMIREHVCVKQDQDDGVVYDISRGLAFALHDDLAEYLREAYYEGYVHFEYWDDMYQSFKLNTDTARPTPPFGDYSVVFEMKKDDTRRWVSATTKLYKVNCALTQGLPGGADFEFIGHGKLRKIRFEFDVYYVEDDASDGTEGVDAVL